MAKPNETDIVERDEKIENRILNREEKKKKARLRRRGPYRKAHSDW